VQALRRQTDFIISKSRSVALYYDADGSDGSFSAVQFATVYSAGATAATLSAGELW